MRKPLTISPTEGWDFLSGVAVAGGGVGLAAALAVVGFSTLESVTGPVVPGGRTITRVEAVDMPVPLPPSAQSEPAPGVAPGVGHVVESLRAASGPVQSIEAEVGSEPRTSGGLVRHHGTQDSSMAARTVDTVTAQVPNVVGHEAAVLTATPARARAGYLSRRTESAVLGPETPVPAGDTASNPARSLGRLRGADIASPGLGSAGTDETEIVSVSEDLLAEDGVVHGLLEPELDQTDASPVQGESPSGDEAAVDTSVLPVANREDVVVWMTIGAATTDNASRRIQGQVLREGWEPYIDFRIKPLLEQGVRRIVVSIPFGYNGDGPFDFDQAIHLEEAAAGSAYQAEFERVLNSFAGAWRPVTRGDYSGGEPVEVICYLGRLREDVDFAPLSDEDWQARYDRSIAPALEAGMSIGFDASSAIRTGTREYRAMRATRDSGVPCYVEARPLHTSAWQHWPVISTEAVWRLTDNPELSQNQRYFRTEELTGPIMRLVVNSRFLPLDRLERIDAAVGVLAEGDTLAIGDNDLPEIIEKLHAPLTASFD